MNNKISIVDEPQKTRAWCRKNKFCGLRQDPILRNMEIWLFGHCVKEVSEAEIKLTDGYAIKKAYADVFGLDVDQVELD